MAPGFDFSMHVHYGFVWLSELGEIPEDLLAARGGQRNGICGAAYPGALSCITGLHTGQVMFRVEVWDHEPDVASDWQEVVEVHFAPEVTELALSTFDTSETILLPSLGPYRARYCASGMDEAHAQDTRMDGDEVTDRYLLSLWPAISAEERIVRQTSAYAASWASVAKATEATEV